MTKEKFLPNDEATDYARSQIIGDSDEIRALLATGTKFAKTDVSILICGETGTGKELIARFLHYSSARRSHPFIPFNCGSILDELMGNELFGHQVGAYTSAVNNHKGLFTQASGGTLFLDEVNSLSAGAQTMLLRVLEEKAVRPLGSTRFESIDVRVIAAVNQNIADLVEAGSFREDLFYRLDVLRLDIPPLRERPEDIHALSRHFLQEFAGRYGVSKHLSEKARQYLLEENWSGNVRQLRNTLLRGYLKSEHKLISLLDLINVPAVVEHKAESLMTCVEYNRAKSIAIEAFERNYLTRLMDQARGNVSLAARIAGKERRALGRLLKKHMISAS